MSRALVLGGGGVVGTAWMLGLAASWRERGLDVAGADRVLGTSAGAIVGALLALGLDPAEIADRPRGGDPDRIAALAELLGTSRWPIGPLTIVVTDATTGQQHLVDRGSGWELPSAVAASTAYPGAFRPVVALGRTWIDGGMSSPTNAHLLGPAARVVLVEPLAHLQPGAVPGGALHVVPDAGSRRAFGRTVADLHDVERWRDAYVAGRAQGAACPEEVAPGRARR